MFSTKFKHIIKKAFKGLVTNRIHTVYGTVHNMNTLEPLKALRNETGLSIIKCKEALEKSGGDIDKAREILREKGTIAAVKKSHRKLGSGVVQSYIHTTKTIGAMVELLCETDFVARNEEFVSLAYNIGLHLAAFQPQFTSREEIPPEMLEKITAEIQETIDTSKSSTEQEKILKEKLAGHIKDVVLLEQAFVKDETQTIKEVIENAIHKFGERIEIGRFTILQL